MACLRGGSNPSSWPVHFNVRVTYKSHTATLPLTVGGSSGPSLMGRNWLTEIHIDWKGIFSVHASENSISPQVNQQLHTTIQSHSDLFKDELGTIKGISAKLKLKQGHHQSSLKLELCLMHYSKLLRRNTIV